MKDTHNSGAGFLFRYRKMFALSLLFGLITGVGITFFIPAKYLSTAIIYPSNSHTRDELASNPQFGYEVESEQLLQLLESRAMRDRTIAEFKLYDYYGIDTNELDWKSELNLRYVRDIQFLRSKYLSLVINVTLEDPELAANVANFQVEEVDEYRASIFQENRDNELKAVENEYTASTERLKSLKDSIYGLVGTDKLLYNFMENLNNENYDASQFVTKPELEPLVERYVFEMGQHRDLRGKVESMRKELETPLPSVYTIDEAVPAYKKVSPSFLVNGMIGALLVFLLTLTFRLLLNKWRELSAAEK